MSVVSYVDMCASGQSVWQSCVRRVPVVCPSCACPPYVCRVSVVCLLDIVCLVSLSDGRVSVVCPSSVPRVPVRCVIVVCSSCGCRESACLVVGFSICLSVNLFVRGLMAV